MDKNAVIREFEKLKNTTPEKAKKPTKKEQILELYSEIKKLLSLGHSAETITKILENTGGIKIAPSTLKKYMAKKRKAKDTSEKKTEVTAKKEQIKEPLKEPVKEKIKEVLKSPEGYNLCPACKTIKFVPPSKNDKGEASGNIFMCKCEYDMNAGKAGAKPYMLKKFYAVGADGQPVFI